MKGAVMITAVMVSPGRTCSWSTEVMAVRPEEGLSSAISGGQYCAIDRIRTFELAFRLRHCSRSYPTQSKKH